MKVVFFTMCNPGVKDFSLRGGYLLRYKDSTQKEQQLQVDTLSESRRILEREGFPRNFVVYSFEELFPNIETGRLVSTNEEFAIAKQELVSAKKELVTTEEIFYAMPLGNPDRKQALRIWANASARVNNLEANIRLLYDIYMKVRPEVEKNE